MSDHTSQTDAIGRQQHDLIDRIGRLTRELHDSLHKLGLDQAIEKTTEIIPEAQSALAAIAVVQASQQRTGERAGDLAKRWDQWFEAPIDLADARSLVADTRDHLSGLAEQTRETGARLRNVSLARPLRDPVGQDVGHLINVLRYVQNQLVEVLAEHRGNGKPNTVRDRSRIDNLLYELGY